MSVKHWSWLNSLHHRLRQRKKKTRPPKRFLCCRFASYRNAWVWSNRCTCSQETMPEKKKKCSQLQPIKSVETARLTPPFIGLLPFYAMSFVVSLFKHIYVLQVFSKYLCVVSLLFTWHSMLSYGIAFPPLQTAVYWPVFTKDFFVVSLFFRLSQWIQRDNMLIHGRAGNVW